MILLEWFQIFSIFYQTTDLLVTTLFKLNGLFTILLYFAKCINTTLMVLFNLFSSWSWDWTLPLSWVVVRFCNTCSLIFSLLKLEHGPKKHVQNVTGIKYESVRFFVIFYFQYKMSFWLLYTLLFCSVSFSRSLDDIIYLKIPGSIVYNLYRLSLF